MEYSSFYGGRRGSSFILRKSYNTVQAMVDDFKLDNCTVNFGQYALISTQNKLNPENGMLFRKDTDINSNRKVSIYTLTNGEWVSEQVPAYGATYVGKVQGAQGAPPELELNTYQQVSELQEDDETTRFALGSYTTPGINEEGEAEQRNIIFNGDASNSNISTYVTYITNNQKVPYVIGEEGSEIYLKDIITSDSFADYNYIPGKYELNIYYNNTETAYESNPITIYNEQIQYISVSQRNPNNNDTTAFIGFEVPRHTFQFTVGATGAYEDPTIDEKGHKTNSSLYELIVPVGKMGPSPENIQVLTVQKVTDEDTVSFSIGNDEQPRTLITLKNKGSVITKQTLPSELNNLQDNVDFSIYVYQIRDYLNEAEGAIEDNTYQYIGLTKQIKSINLNNEGILTIEYSSSEKFTSEIHYINDFHDYGTIDPQQPDEKDYSKAQFVFNDGSVTSSFNFNYVNQIEEVFANELPTGQLRIYTRDGDYTNVPFNYVQSIEEGYTSPEEGQPTQPTPTGNLIIKTRDGNTEEIPFNYITNIQLITSSETIAENNGDLIATTRDGDTQNIGHITYVKNVARDDNVSNLLHFQHNDNTADTDIYFDKIVDINTQTGYGSGTVEYFAVSDFINTVPNKYINSIDSTITTFRKTPDTGLNTSLINLINPLFESFTQESSNDIKLNTINIILNEDTQNKYIQYTINRGENQNEIISTNGTDRISKIETVTDGGIVRFLVLYSSLLTRIQLIINNEAYNPDSSNPYYFNDEYGWQQIATTEQFEKESIDFSRDISVEFQQYVEQAATGSEAASWLPSVPSHVIKYLSTVYPNGTYEGEKLNIVTIKVGSTEWVVQDSPSQTTDTLTLVTSDIVNSIAFVPSEWTSSESRIYAEPIFGYYYFNSAITEYTFRTSTQFSGDVTDSTAVVTFLQETGNYTEDITNKIQIRSGTNIYLVETAISNSEYEYSFYIAKGWINISNLLSNNGGGDSGNINITDYLVFGQNSTAINNVSSGGLLFVYEERTS